MHKDQLRILIRDILTQWTTGPNLWSESAEELLMLTAAVESNLGEYIRQIGGPARGIFQMEPDTHDDIWQNYLIYKPLSFRVRIHDYASNRELVENLEWNLAYQIVMARIHYLRVEEPLPELLYHFRPSDKYVDGASVRKLAEYWKKYYNTSAGKGTVEKAIQKYNQYVL